MSLIDISPYKFDGPAGSGAPPHVHKVPAADGFHGRYKREDPDFGGKYAEDVRDLLRRLDAGGVRPAAFILESLLSCAGQVVLPDGYLKDVYRYVRGAGGLCIADEVQVGFGRVGGHFWGFETQGVVPDIVTMGKPMGNGHPIGAVVTTPEIAAAFDNGMEYFNTFGGNPVSCAAALAVLDVLESENLQAHALRVGEYLKQSLNTLRASGLAVEDIRGMGLFIGVEMARDSDARSLVEMAKARGVLLSMDGPLHNVVKIKPPMVFTESHCDALVNACLP